MPRRLKAEFRCEAIGDLTRQLRYAPAQRKATQVRNAEALHDAIEPTVNYPFDFIAFRVTGHHSDSEPDTVLVGEAVGPDLRLLIDELSRSAPQPAGDDEALETPDELAGRLGVSTKTVGRWRSAGLRWRWVRDADGTPRVRIARAASDAFVAANAKRVARAQRFTHLSDADRQRLLALARGAVAERPDLSLNRVARRLAAASGRALETCRLLLEQHDREHPDDRLFPDRGPMSDRDRRLIVRAHRMGIAAGPIAQHVGRSTSTVYRVVQTERAAELRRRRFGWHELPTFARPDADAVLLRADEPVSSTSPSVDDLPEPLRAVFDQPALDDAGWRTLVIRLNYLRWSAAARRDALDHYAPKRADLDEIERRIEAADALYARLVRAGLPVVLTAARRELLGRSSTREADLLPLLELGVPVLLEAVNDCDPARETLPALLTHRLMRRFAQAEPEVGKAQRRDDPQRVADRIGAMLKQAGLVQASVPNSRSPASPKPGRM